MGALSAIETPVGAADARSAAGGDATRGERRLRVVGESMEVVAVRAAACSGDSAQPRSSSIRQDRHDRLRAGRTSLASSAFAAGPAATTAPSPAFARRTTVPVLVGTVVEHRGKRTAPAAAAGASHTPLRLTRRGRIVVAALVVALLSVAVLVVTIVLSGRAQATNHGQPGAGYHGLHQVVVRSGQTLWSIAAAAEPGADPRDVIQEIMTANALGSPTITAGQLLWVP